MTPSSPDPLIDLHLDSEELSELRDLLAEARRALQGHRVDARPWAEYASETMFRLDRLIAEIDRRCTA